MSNWSCWIALVATTVAAFAADAGKFTLTVIDIPDVQRGSGLAIVMQTPSGKTFLYDTGNGYPSKTNQTGWVAEHNTARDLIAPFLKERGISTVDGVAISHAHYDHFGGLAWMMDNYPTKKLYDAGYNFPGQASTDYTGELGHYAKIRETFKKRGAYQEAHTGDKLAWDPALEIEVISPPKEFFSEPHPERRPKADPPAHYLVNANSLGLRIRHGDVVFLLPGDIQAEDQRQSLLPSLAAEKFKCHVLIAPGHGIHSIPEFAEATRPEVTICSVFPRYAKGSPAPKVYGKVGSKVYLTGIHGRVTVVSDGKKFIATPEREAAETKPAPAPKKKPANNAAFKYGSPDEPLLEKLSLAKAAESLDRTSLVWVQQRKCGACHTTYPYLMSRAALGGEPSPALQQVRKFFDDRIASWEADAKTNKHILRETVANAASLAVLDAQTTGKLQPLTRIALDKMWTLQRKDGAWSWPKCSWPPFEVDDYYGALLAALGVGHAPDGYAQGDSAKAGLAKLHAYFEKTPPPSLHHKTWLLWASLKLEGVMTAAQRKATTEELLALQRTDGGWSMESLGKDWVGREGEKANANAPSDGYGTGLVVFVLRQAGVPATHVALQRGVAWLSSNQRASGRWFTRSMNGVEEHFISDTATAFAVLALKACE